MSDWSWPSFLREIDAIEKSWIIRGAKPAPGMVGWIPQPVGQFTAMLMDAVAASRVTRPVFLDVGSGPGSKVLLATALFGIRGYGIELSQDMAHFAQARGVDTLSVDALQYDGYGLADIVLLNRPVQDRQAECEHRVRDLMRRDAILIHVNGAADPGEDWDWELISQEYGRPVAGVWRKSLSPGRRRRATPDLARRALPCPTRPGRAVPCLPSQALPFPALPNLAKPAEPRLAVPSRALPSHACRALPSPAQPSLA